MIIPFKDTPENKNCRTVNRWAETVLDVAGFHAYVVQRNNRISQERLKNAGFMGWSEEQFAAAEAEYQEEMR